jgi:hypothetical protein
MTQHAFKPILLDLLRLAQTEQNAFFQALPPGELERTGLADAWAAKDHVAHLTFWRRCLVLRLQAQLQNLPQPTFQHFEELNPLVFEENRYRIWPNILSESDQVYSELIALTEQLTEEDLTAFDRFEWMHGTPLYISFMGNCYEHSLIHLGYYLLDHNDLERATELYEVWIGRAVEAGVPDRLTGHLLYNLACFYATHNQIEKADPALRRAFVLYPEVREFAPTDPDLAELDLSQFA